MTNDELEAIECGDALADPPPWSYNEDQLESREVVELCSTADPPIESVYPNKRIVARFPLRQGERRNTDIQNLFFVANARLNVRELCAALRNAQARIEELEAQRDQIHKDLIDVEKNYDQKMRDSWPGAIQ